MNDIGSNGSEVDSGKGNTSPSPKNPRIAPSKRWCFTLNNPTVDEQQSLGSLVPPICDYLVIGREVGESGTPHLQGYVEFARKVRPLSALATLPRIHWEKAKGTKEQNLSYCTKDGDIFLSKGLPPKLKDRYDPNLAREWQKEVLKICDEEPDWRKIHWYFDYEGNTGKSTVVRHLMITRNDTLYLSKGKYADIAYVICQTDMSAIKNILVDLPRNNGAHVSFDALEALKNGMILSTKYEGKMVIFNPVNVIVFANAEPDENCLSADRWVIRQIHE